MPIAAATILLLLSSNAAADDCLSPVSVDALEATLDIAEQAFIELDKQALLMASDRVTHQVPCLDERLDRDLVVRFHRVQALGLWLAGDQGAAVFHFASASVASGGAPLPDGLVPAGHPMHREYAAVRGMAWSTRALEEPAQGFILVDGALTLSLPTERSSLVQYLGADGTPTWTALHAPGGELPDYPRRIPVADRIPVAGGVAQSQASSSPEHRRAPRVVLGAAVAGAVASGAMLAGSMYASQLYWDSTSVAMAEDRRRLTNGLAAGGATGLVVAIGVGAVALVEWRF